MLSDPDKEGRGNAKYFLVICQRTLNLVGEHSKSCKSNHLCWELRSVYRPVRPLPMNRRSKDWEDNNKNLGDATVSQRVRTRTAPLLSGDPPERVQSF